MNGWTCKLERRVQVERHLVDGIRRVAMRAVAGDGNEWLCMLRAKVVKMISSIHTRLFFIFLFKKSSSLMCSKWCPRRTDGAFKHR